jgi:hypothetical protein
MPGRLFSYPLAWEAGTLEVFAACGTPQGPQRVSSGAAVFRGRAPYVWCVRTTRGEGSGTDWLKGNRDQTRAKQHKAGCCYREESIGYEVMITHAWYAFVIAPLTGQNNASRRTVKRIPGCSEN